jgi:hypothetical protein
MNLERDPRWEIFFGDISLTDFAKSKIPLIRWRKDVNQGIKDAFKVVQKLLILSYYEYLFVDTAVNRSLQLFEMALKIRYKEINNTQWKSKGRLVEIIEWFRSRDYFERDDEEFLNHVRSTRNHLSHPERHTIAGGMWFHWIETTVDLINDLYEDIELRKVRRTVADGLLKNMSNFSVNGAKLKLIDQEILIYKSADVLVNSWESTISAYIGLLPVFDVTTTKPRVPLILYVQTDSLDLTSTKIELVDQSGNPGFLTSDLENYEMKLINEIRQKIALDDHYIAINASLHFDVAIEMQRIWRRIRFENEISG